MAQEIAEQLFVGEVAQKAVIEREGKVLLSRDVDAEYWDIPGGRLHVGESAHAGLAREVKEEIGIDIEIQQPFYTEPFIPVNPKKSLRPRFMVVYRAIMSDPNNPFILASDEIAEVRWVGKEEIDVIPIYPEYRRMFETYFAIVK